MRLAEEQTKEFGRKDDSAILLTGGSGQVGTELRPLLAQFGKVIAPNRAELDLADAVSIRDFLRAAKPRWIVNPAAYTAVDKAESEPESARAINSVAPGVFGEEAARLGIPVIHFSTDYVFDGSGSDPWNETDPTGPLGVYGETKLAGEKSLAASGAAHVILRTSWVYAAHGKNFLRTMLRLAAEREELRVVDDQHGAPTAARDLAELVVRLMAATDSAAAGAGIGSAEKLQQHSGVFHAANSGETTWFGFAQEILRLASAAAPGTRLAQLIPIPTAEFPTPARRPANSRLNCTRLLQEFGIQLPEWQDSLKATMSHLLATGAE